jgi:hypothetical protein
MYKYGGCYKIPWYGMSIQNPVEKGDNNMGKKKARKIIWDEKGVSEILADMLILVITITLFSSVLLFLYTQPTPDDSAYAEFDSHVEYSDEGGTINVTHIQGESLKGDYTKIYLAKNTQEEIRILDTQGSDFENPSYGIQGDKNWDCNEKWSYFFGGIESKDDLEISIVDLKSNSLILKSRLYCSGHNSPPIIMERGYNPSPAINGTEVTITARVFDPNGRHDLDRVYFNASELNNGLQDVEMEDQDGDGIFKVTILISRGAGNLNLTIEARDNRSSVDYGRLRVRIVEASKPVFQYVTCEPNSVEAAKEFRLNVVIIDMEGDLNYSSISVTPDTKFYENSGTIDTSFEMLDQITLGGVFETSGSAPNAEGVYNLTVSAGDHSGFVSTKLISLAVIRSDIFVNDSFNDSIWAYIGPESLDFKKFYYTIDNPPTNSSTYHLAVYIEEDHVGDDCFLHINVINHYYEDVYIDGNSRIRLLQIGGAASNKDLGIVQNGTSFGYPVGTTPDGTWYRIPAAENKEYFHGGEPVSLVFGPFDLNSAKETDVFGSILVLTGSFGEESISPGARYGQTLPYQAIVIA